MVKLKNKHKRHPMEILWMCFALLCLLAAINVHVHKGIGDAASMYGCTVLAIMMYLWRRSLRKKEENNPGGQKMQ